MILKGDIGGGHIAIARSARRLPFGTVARNLLPIIRAKMTGRAEAERLLSVTLCNPLFSPEGIFRARIGFAHARRAAQRQNASILLAKIERALAKA